MDETSVKQLAQSASTRKLRYLFPFTTYVKSDRSFSPSYSHATEFVSQFRRFNQETLLLAWIGIPLKWVDLADKSTRQEIITFVLQLLQEAQFDGIHLDVEAILNNNASYLIFLEEMRSALGPRYIISIAGSQWLPSYLDKLPQINDGQLMWDNEYYQAVADQVDQIAVMAYDSFQSYPAVYRLWLREQARGLNSSLLESGVELLIGISVSREYTPSHDPLSENMQNGLAGVCAGLPALKQNKIQGIAIYASWEADQADWRFWDEWIDTPLDGE